MTILIVDDSAPNRKLLRATLEAEGYLVLEAKDGVEALAVLAGGPPDAIVSDVVMPRMDGYRLCHKVRQMERFNTVPFIFFTATYSEPGDEQRALGLGADLFLLKPASMATFVEALRRVMSRPRTAKPASLLALSETDLMREYSDRLVSDLEQKNVELSDTLERLQASEEHFRQITENVADIIALLDLQGRRIYNNPAYRTLLGDPADKVGTNSFSEVHPDDSKRIRGIFGETVRTGVGQRTEYRLIGYDGSVHDIESRGSVIRDATGRITNVLVVGRDVTERKRLEEQLRQSQKMDSIGQLAGGVAHDFNNMLTVIQGYTEMVMLDQRVPADLAGLLKEVHAAGSRAASLTRQLLMFSRKQPMRVGVLNLNDVIGNAAKMLHRLIGEHIAFQWEGCPTLPPIQADAGMMDQILLNLAVNARDAMPHDGRLTISTTAVELEAACADRNPEARAGRFICLAVNDNGCGMSLETQKHIFEPFFTTKETGKGTGLGLATVFGIVQQHEGWIEVESALGVGTTFKVFLPAAADLAPAAARGGESKVCGGTETILVVEDEEMLRELAAMVLTKHGYQVLQAGTGAQALEVWQAQASQISLVLTDMVMPGGMNGRELGMRLLADKPTLKVVYVTGYSPGFGKLDHDLKEGVNFLPKPYRPDQLAQTVRICLDQKS